MVLDHAARVLLDQVVPLVGRRADSPAWNLGPLIVRFVVYGEIELVGWELNVFHSKFLLTRYDRYALVTHPSLGR